MDSLIRADNEYKTWVESISSRYKKCQIKAAVKVNAEMLKFYYNLGKEIFELKAESKWGTGFYQNLSYDLSVHLPNIKGFSVTNLKYMRRFYELFSDVESIHPQLVDEFETELIFTVPWGHIRNIIDKCSDDPQKALFYIKETINNN